MPSQLPDPPLQGAHLGQRADAHPAVVQGLDALKLRDAPKVHDVPRPEQSLGQHDDQGGAPRQDQGILPFALQNAHRFLDADRLHVLESAHNSPASAWLENPRPGYRMR